MAPQKHHREIPGRRAWRKVAIASVSAALTVPLGMTPLASASTASPSGSITYFWWGDPIRNQLTNAVIKLYEKAHPTVKVQGEELAWTNYWQKVTVEAAAHTLPCVTQTQSRELETYTSGNVLMNLNNLVNSGQINVSEIPKSILDTGMVGGKLEMIPYGAAYDALVYNETMVSKAGLAPPKRGWDYAQFGAWLKALQAKLPKGVYATDLTGTDSDAFLIYAQTYGYSLFNKSGQLGFPASLLQRFWGIWENYVKEGIAAPEAMYASEPTSSEESYLVKGRVAVEAEPGNQYSDVVSAAATSKVGKMGLMLYPYGPRGLGEAIITSGLSIPANCNNVPAAASFINFFTNNPTAAKVFASNNGAVTDTPLLNNQINSPQTPPAVKLELSTYKFIASQHVPLVLYPSGYTQVFTDLFLQVAEKIFSGEESVSAGTKSFMQQAKVDLAS
jgi:multiple sugar transport system substrate-binding protein